MERALPILISVISDANGHASQLMTRNCFWDNIVLIACFGEVATHPLLSDFDAFAGCGVWRWWRRLVDARKRKVRFIISVSAAAQVQNYPPPVQALNPHIARNCHFQLEIWIRLQNRNTPREGVNFPLENFLTIKKIVYFSIIFQQKYSK